MSRGDDRRNSVRQDESFIVVVDECRFDLLHSLNMMIRGAESIHAHKQALVVEETSRVVRVLDVILHYAFPCSYLYASLSH